uniref:uncharacterized protein LOC122585213 n=1 Tax=Erigeron canadensis TaxID=72917 RepID=UPI001CB9AEBC|nr:uncharacterized protein LOC122585213 [Erigeron canadensis]XP_043613260.1 uncharacterized protein LOC122585213 [Erigeron canadensis]
MELERDECKNKYAVEVDKCGVLSTEVAALKNTLSAKDASIQDLEQKFSSLQLDREQVVQGLPSLVSKLIDSFEFSQEMGTVQKYAMAVGVHKGLDRAAAAMPGLEISMIKGYQPNAMDKLEKAAERFQKKKYVYLESIASSSHLPASAILAISPAPKPVPKPAKKSSGPTLSSAPSGSTVHAS